jgi:PKD repeat protein
MAYYKLKSFFTFGVYKPQTPKHMKKLLTLFTFFTLVISYNGLHSQACSPDTSYKTAGFGPSPGIIRQGVNDTACAQIYVPASLSGVTLDSLVLDSITGLPTNISYSINPASGLIIGGSHGVITFTGTTTDTLGDYYLTFYGAAYTTGAGNFGLDTPPANAAFSYYLAVVGPAPVASFSAATTGTCAPSTVSFTDHSTNSPTSWNWNYGDGSVADTIQNPSHTFLSAGNFVVTETASSLSGSSTHSDTVVVKGSPILTDSIHAASSSSATDGSAIVSASGSGPFTYHWSGSLAAASDTTDALTGAAPGTYNVTVTGGNSCKTVDTIVITYSTGINTLADNVSVKIYPNPASDVLNFQWNLKTLGEVVLYDLTGSIVKIFAVGGDAVNHFDISRLEAGTYVVRVTDKQNNQQRSSLFSKL